MVAINDEQMAGSAAAYLPDHDDADKLWAWEIRRDCGERPFCLTLPTEFPGVPLDESMFFIFRAYVQPGLSVSADPAELLPERAFLVTGGP